jgi:hypothetical protein
MRVRQGVVELSVSLIVFNCVGRSGLKQGFAHARLAIASIDLTMTTGAKPGVDVLVHRRSASRWGAASQLCPGFFRGTHNEPNHAAEAEQVLRFHIGPLHHSFPGGTPRSRVAGKRPEEPDQISGSFERLQTPVVHVNYVIATLRRVGLLKATLSASDSFEVRDHLRPRSPSIGMVSFHPETIRS